MAKLIDSIRLPEFDASLYDGIMMDDFQFVKYFPLNDKTTEECFQEVNIFLTQNGYPALNFDEFIDELTVTNDMVNLYADPYSNESNKQLILVIKKLDPLNNQINELILQLIKFRNERDWKQFHNPKDLAIALNVESSELLELFLWKNPGDENKQKVKEELADIFAFAFLLADKYGFDVREIVLEKIKSNAEKYPVDKSKGTAKKYNEL